MAELLLPFLGGLAGYAEMVDGAVPIGRRGHEDYLEPVTFEEASETMGSESPVVRVC